MMHVQRPAADTFFMVGTLTQSGRAQSEERKTVEVYKTGGRSDPLVRHKYNNTRRVKKKILSWNSGATRTTSLTLLIKRL